MTQFVPEDLNRRGRFVTDTEMMAIKEAAVNEVRYLADNISRELERTRKQLELAESLIPLNREHTYRWLSAQPIPSFGGTDPD